MTQPFVCKPTYVLGDLLNEVSQGLYRQSLRQFKFTFYEGLSYIVELTDARTLRLRYLHDEAGMKNVLCYMDNDRHDVLMREVDKDIRQKLSAFKTVNQTGLVSLYVSGQMKPVSYRIKPGGFSYIRID